MRVETILETDPEGKERSPLKPRAALDDISPYEPPRMAWDIDADRGSKVYA